MRPGSWAVAAKRPSVTARKLSSRCGRPVTMKEKGCGERKLEARRKVRQVSGPVGILLFRIFVVV